LFAELHDLFVHIARSPQQEGVSMTYRRLLVMTVLALSTALAACRREEPPAPPPPPTATPPVAPAPDNSAAEAAAAAAAAEAERQRRIGIARGVLTQRIHFDYDESALRDDARQILGQKVTILRSSPQVNLRVEGHADERGSTEYNMALGNRRAQSVLDYFTQQGLAGTRFMITSLGEELPLVNASNESAWSQNRRAEFAVTAGDNSIMPAP
jgi:peptidoglycan-associated lipoprotein